MHEQLPHYSVKEKFWKTNFPPFLSPKISELLSINSKQKLIENEDISSNEDESDFEIFNTSQKFI